MPSNIRGGQILRIGTVRLLNACDACACRHGPVIAHCTDSEDFPRGAPSFA